MPGHVCKAGNRTQCIIIVIIWCQFYVASILLNLRCLHAEALGRVKLLSKKVRFSCLLPQNVMWCLSDWGALRSR